jgi:hypothetical protein
MISILLYSSGHKPFNDKIKAPRAEGNDEMHENPDDYVNTIINVFSSMYLDVLFLSLRSFESLTGSIRMLRPMSERFLAECSGI